MTHNNGESVKATCHNKREGMTTHTHTHRGREREKQIHTL